MKNKRSVTRIVVTLSMAAVLCSGAYAQEHRRR